MGPRREPLGPYFSSQLQGIVAAAYPLFAVPAPTKIHACTDCCIPPALAQAMLATPPQDMTRDQLWRWYDAAKDKELPASLAFWFLPRVMDFLARGVELASLGDATLFQHIGETHPVPDWPEPQRLLFQEFAIWFMDAKLDHNQPDLDANLVMFAKSGMDVQPILDHLSGVDPFRLARALVNQLERNPRKLGQDMYWFDGPARHAVTHWLDNDALAERLMDWAIAHDSDKPSSDLVWKAVHLIT